MGNTQENLQQAFAGESQANRRYLFFAGKADKLGDSQIAKLFRAAAEAETVHARNHFQVLGASKSNKENLETAQAGEHYEFSQMYPGFLEIAKQENNKAAANSFNLANQVEQIHHQLFGNALDNLVSGKASKDVPYYVCQVCGNTVEGEPPEKCPICNSPKSKFKRID
ncbi:MAG: rubrerythrin family protein [Chloroflexota bacterium]